MSEEEATPMDYSKLTYCLYQEKPLELETAIKILENVEKHRTVHNPAVKPKGGEIYLYVPQKPEEQDNWKCDQYRWLNNGPKEIPRRGPLVRKFYYLARVPEGKTFQFQRHAYMLIADTRTPKPVLIHYIGDESIMIDFPHGNAKKSERPFYAVAPSVRREIARKSLASPTDIIESMKSKEEETKSNPVLTPRNKNQIRNLKRRQRILDAGQKIRKTALVNLMEMIEHIPGYVHYSHSFPDSICVIGLPELSLVLDELLNLPSIDPLVFSYCEPFKIGKLSVAVFMFEHVAFSDKPGFPTHAVIYDNERSLVHEKLLNVVLQSVPSLKGYKGPILTGRESLLTKALQKTLPDLFQVSDWEHVIISTRLWLRANGATVSRITTFTDHLRLLLDSPSKTHYQEKFMRFSESWPADFRQFYDEKLRAAIEERLGRWILQRYSLFSNKLGVTDLLCEGLQLLMRDMQDVKDPSIDSMAIAFYHLSVYLSNEITKGFCNFGSYRLRRELHYMLRGADEMIFVENTFPPNTIVDALRANRLPHHASSGSHIDEASLAERIFTAGGIFHAKPMQAFLVRGVSEDLHAVKLYPREYCTCAPKETCCHILAVKLSLGIVQSQTKPKVNHPTTTIITSPGNAPAQHPATPSALDIAAATQTLASLVTSGSAALSHNPAGQQVFPFDSFIEALTVAKDCIGTPPQSTSLSPQGTPQ
eukprot:gene15337-16914_t